jgi:hypothetical protein
MHGFACRRSVRPMSRRRLLLALTVSAALSVLAIAAPARADSVTDWDQIAAAALQAPGLLSRCYGRLTPGHSAARAGSSRTCSFSDRPVCRWRHPARTAKDPPGAWMRDPLAVPDGELLTHSPRAAP